jgi:hypothetical protein
VTGHKWIVQKSGRGEWLRSAPQSAGFHSTWEDALWWALFSAGVKAGPQDAVGWPRGLYPAYDAHLDQAGA